MSVQGERVTAGAARWRATALRALAAAGVLALWQLAFWPVVHGTERLARPPGMDLRPQVAYQFLDGRGEPLDGGVRQYAARNEAPVAYYVTPRPGAARVRFLVPFEVRDATAPLALFLGARNSVDEIRINGQLIQSLSPVPRIQGLVTSEPAYVPIPAERLVAGPNLLAIETPNFGTQWLAEFAIGPQPELGSAYRWKTLLQTDLALVGLAVLVFTLLLCVVVRWPEEDRPRIRALVLLLGTCAASTYLLIFSPPVPLSVDATVFLYTLSSSFIALAVLAYVLLDYPELETPRRVLRWGWWLAPLACAVPVVGASLLGPHGRWLGMALQASFWLVSVVGVVALALLAHTLVRQRGARWFERSMLAFCIATFVMDRVGSIVPLYSPFDPALQLTLGWSQIVGALLGLSIVVALAREATEARRTVLSASAELNARLAEREAELQQVHQREQESQRRTVLLEERQRIVRDMHDGIGGQLLGLALQARSAGADVRQLADGLDASLLDLRLIIDSMDTAESGLAESIMAFAHRLRPQVEGAGLALQLDNRLWPGNPVIGSRFTLQLMRVLQEAVANALRHSGARMLRIEAREEGTDVVLVVSDDGAGMPATPRMGRGLANMRTRTVALGASLEITDARPGVRVCLRLPRSALVPPAS